MIYMFLDEPKANKTIYNHIMRIAGWAISDTQPIERVEIYQDGKYIADAEYGQERRDVQKAYPNISESAFSGFLYYLRTDLKGGYNKIDSCITVKAVAGPDNYELGVRALQKFFVVKGKNILRNPFKVVSKKYEYWLQEPLGYLKISKAVDTTKIFKVLDLGCGNHSAKRFTNYFNCEYHGVDISRDYNNSQSDFNLMAGFYEIDLTTLAFDSIPNDFFDVIYCSHIIEHLFNGDQVISKMFCKLKYGGVMYLEYPSRKSIFFPSKPGTLNFYDDESHIRLYSLYELLNVFTVNNMKVLDKGVCRRVSKIFAMPFLAIRHKFHGGGVLEGGFFWDLYGFAEYIVAQKPE